MQAILSSDLRIPMRAQDFPLLFDKLLYPIKIKLLESMIPVVSVDEKLPELTSVAEIWVDVPALFN
jgi:hypothetical protein